MKQRGLKFASLAMVLFVGGGAQGEDAAFLLELVRERNQAIEKIVKSTTE